MRDDKELVYQDTLSISNLIKEGTLGRSNHNKNNNNKNKSNTLRTTITDSNTLFQTQCKDEKGKDKRI